MNEKKNIFMEFQHAVQKWMEKEHFVIICMLDEKNISSRGGRSAGKHPVPDPPVLF